jgi:hypothetical protein
MNANESKNFVSWLNAAKADSKDEIMAAIFALLSKSERMDVDKSEPPVSFDPVLIDPAYEIVPSAPVSRSLNEINSEFALLDELKVAKAYIRQLEEDNSSLKGENASLNARLTAIKSSLSITSAELSALKAKLPVAPLACPIASAPVSFAEAVTATSPPRPWITKRTRSSMQVQQTAGQPKPRPAIDYSIFTVPSTLPPEKPHSKLVFVYFKGLLRAPPSHYRAMLEELGVPSGKIRDIMFLANNLVQFLTYQDRVEMLKEILIVKFPGITHLPDADPCDPFLCLEYGNVSREQL